MFTPSYFALSTDHDEDETYDPWRSKECEEGGARSRELHDSMEVLKGTVHALREQLDEFATTQSRPQSDPVEDKEDKLEEKWHEQHVMHATIETLKQTVQALQDQQNPEADARSQCSNKIELQLENVNASSWCLMLREQQIAVQQRQEDFEASLKRLEEQHRALVGNLLQPQQVSTEAEKNAPESGLTEMLQNVNERLLKVERVILDLVLSSTAKQQSQDTRQPQEMKMVTRGAPAPAGLRRPERSGDIFEGPE